MPRASVACYCECGDGYERVQTGGLPEPARRELQTATRASTSFLPKSGAALGMGTVRARR